MNRKEKTTSITLILVRKVQSNIIYKKIMIIKLYNSIKNNIFTFYEILLILINLLF